MEKLQLIYPYYENPQMLEVQLRTWETWPTDLRHKTRIILIDDGSQKHPISADHIRHCGHPDIVLARVLINIPWNQNGAHNLGFHLADEGWCLTTDIDHVVVEKQLRTILSLPLNRKMYYSFGRRQVRAPDVKGFKRHPNSWLLTRALFFEAGGYDEDFAGFYGSDSTFRRALTLVGKHCALPDSCYLVVYDEKDLPDANTREWGRKDSKYYSANYPHLVKKKSKAYKAENPLRFPWERVI